MELYFTESENISENEATFDAFESRHIIKTMRKRSGDLIQFTDGKGSLYQGKITSTHPVLRITFSLANRKIWPPAIPSALGIGFIRPSRMDYLIEKATELGITRFYLFPSRHSNYRTDNTSRWEKISRQAMKQSNRVYLPEIRIISNMENMISETAEMEYKYIAEQNASRKLDGIISKERDLSQKSIIFILGPEGGFDEEEINLCKQNSFIPLTFGNYRLRTETAAITAASYINLIRN